MEKIGKELLSEARVDSPGLSARILLEHASGLSKMDYILARREEAAEEIREEFFALLERRKRGEPIAYITGRKEFFGRNFHINDSCLIPRPETEQLVELALQFMPAAKCNFLDAGCGSGCIGLTLLAERCLWMGVLLDKFEGAMETAQKNARNLNLTAQFVRGDIFNAPFARNSFDLVVSNPPYISPDDKAEVMSEALDFEPWQALFSDEGGLSHMKYLARLAIKSLRPGGFVIVEHGWRQSEKVRAIFESAGFANICAYRDLANLSRCVAAQKIL